MFIMTIFLLAFFSTLILLLCWPIITQWYNFYVAIIVFLEFFLLYTIFFAIFVAIYTKCTNKKKEPHPTKFDMRFMKRCCEFVCQLGGVRINTRGLEKLPTDSNFLLIQNHLSGYDPLVTAWALRYYDFNFIIKKSLFNVPFVGNFLYKSGQLAIDRENNREGLKTILKAIKTLEEGKTCIAVYPEGTRSKDAEIAHFHEGTFKMALKSQKPLVITVIINSESVKLRSIFKPTEVYLDIIDVWNYEDYKDMSTAEIAEKVHGMIENRILELDELRYKKNA